MERVVAFYDALKCPLTYDFAQFASAAKTVAGDRPLHFVFVPNKVGGWSKPNKFDPAEAEFRRLHIVLGLAPLFGSYTVCQDREHAKLYETFGEIYPKGYTVDKPVFDYQMDSVIRVSGLPRRGPKPSDKAVDYVAQWLGGRRPITVTLRHSRYPVRNSNLSAWDAFAKDHDVVFVPDTDTAFLTGWGDGALTLASISVDIRLALYSQSRLNCFTSNGCAMPLIMTDIPYLSFKAGADGYMGKDQWDKLLIPYGTQPWFVQPNQKWVWEDDNLDVIRREVEDFHRLG